MILSIEHLIEHGRAQLDSCSDSAKLDAQLLLCFVLEKERSYLLTWPDKILSQAQSSQYLELLARRINGEPIAYIVGVKEFWSLPFFVSPATLIPRPDTEILIELVLTHYGEKQNLNCLDLGTGTGAIALALASELPSWHIDAIDFSFDAVALAKRNAKALALSQVNIYQSDWFSKVSQSTPFEIIVSNPPYIDGNDENLSVGDVRFEPKSALVANEQGLGDIADITAKAVNYLVPNGALFFEHGFEQGEAVRNILRTAGFNGIETVKDLNGHDRITWGKLSITSKI
ncbi:peptide chain release factor N(5)-glutamine methyltransferase [Colwellia sp. D2M02]|uniref:peptide chain release factor N(5)-glutamine methyltransferase n=1 Tax=Colwellia sp. D2M02 TaxID=2841562 RepID=UPI001C099908|nr:peptide chain release factor N(5)-glutamine methyltransferase [Colwellia sp. D2M02]